MSERVATVEGTYQPMFGISKNEKKARKKEEEGLKFIERQIDRLSQGIGYSFVIAKESNDQAVGSIGLWLRNIEDGRTSIGHWVVASQRGHGASSCAIKAVARWAFEELQISRLELCVEPWNLASIHTAEQASFKREGLLRSWQQVGDKRRYTYIYIYIYILTATHR
jgi:RimJ/RimL family protein N-acetyltransferase